MEITFSTILHLVIFVLMPVAATLIFYFLDSKTSFKKFAYWPKQILIGIAFGGLAIIATEFGIQIPGAVINVRDAAPICAGLIFGGPAGIIAGCIGGIERWFCVFWGGGTYTRLACSLATILAGIITAIFRKMIFNNKRPTWPYGLFLALQIEVIHMLLIFFTNMDDIHTAFSFVTTCSAPMILCNCIAVTLPLLILAFINKEFVHQQLKSRKIISIFAVALLIDISLAFGITIGCTFAIQNSTSLSEASNKLAISIEDVRDDITNWANIQLESAAKSAANRIDAAGTCSNALMDQLLAENSGVFSEISVINEQGIVVYSSNRATIGYDMASNEQSAPFLVLLNGEENTFTQEIQERGYDGQKIKYYGVTLKKGGFVQVGCNTATMHQLLDDKISSVVDYRSVDENGFMIVTDKNNVIISDPNDNAGKQLESLGIYLDKSKPEDEMFEMNINGKSYYVMYTTVEEFTILALIPEDDVNYLRDLTVYLTAFMDVIIFFALFVMIYYLIRKLIIDNIHAINESLKRITRGNLDETVRITGNEEFTSLSKDINTTVTALKSYIQEAKARIDKELEVATVIQASSLPSEFPPFPDRTEFDIYATMTPAKEVGGDFYDFYFLDEDRLAFLIADVSGKGITGAMFMMKAKAVLKGEAEVYDDVEDILSGANEALCQGNDAEMFVTCWMGILDLSDYTLTYGSAGHNPPLVRKKDGKFEYLKGRPNFVLAGLEGAPYVQHEMKLEPGDEIILYTDGVTEATDLCNELYGEDRLLKILNSLDHPSCEEICFKIKEDIDDFVGEAPQFDDITILSLQVMR